MQRLVAVRRVRTENKRAKDVHALFFSFQPFWLEGFETSTCLFYLFVSSKIALNCPQGTSITIVPLHCVKDATPSLLFADEGGSDNLSRQECNSVKNSQSFSVFYYPSL